MSSLTGSDWEEKKKDPNEVTFQTTTEFLPFWRAVLRYRYMTDIPAVREYTTWIDYERVDGHLQEVAWLRRQRAVFVCHPCATMPDDGQAAPRWPETAHQSCTCTGQTGQHSHPGTKKPQLGARWVQASLGCGLPLPSRCHSHQQTRPQPGAKPPSLPLCYQ